MEKKYKIGDQVIMKKNHACGANLWVITRTGVDIKLKCTSCNHEIMLDRLAFEKKLKKIIGDNNEA